MSGRVRPGWGVRHPALADVLRSSAAVAVEETRWANGTLVLRASAYLPLVELADELVVSVRCLVTVAGRLVMCTNADGTHAWPGGRREPGETYAETARREVHEETGWVLEPASVRPLGWLHLEHLAAPPQGYAYPHPDFLQVVLAGCALVRDDSCDARRVDSEGYEASTQLVPVEHVAALLTGDRLSQLARPFLDSL